MSRLLIFPAGLPQARSYANEYRAAGGQPIGGSSLERDAEASHYTDWVTLPFAHQDTFADALVAVIDQYAITEMYVPHPVAWRVVHKVLDTKVSGTRLLNADPLDAVSTTYRFAMEAAVAYDALPPLDFAGVETPAPRLTTLQRAALFQATERVPGMCSIEKQFVFSEIARFIPRGDIVEIGSWWGKSAFLLASLASRFQLGNVLCVDPWSVDNIDQSGGQGVLDTISRQLDCEEAFRIFTLNLAGFPDGRVNYLRAPSLEAARQYRHFPKTIDTPELGQTFYTGSIALLHVDGNHAFEAANEDIDGWAPALCPGGWLIVDDYCWTYGDGPRRAADNFVLINQDLFERAFVAGGTFYARRRID